MDSGAQMKRLILVREGKDFSEREKQEVRISEDIEKY